MLGRLVGANRGPISIPESCTCRPRIASSAPASPAGSLRKPFPVWEDILVWGCCAYEGTSCMATAGGGSPAWCGCDTDPQWAGPRPLLRSCTARPGRPLPRWGDASNPEAHLSIAMGAARDDSCSPRLGGTIRCERARAATPAANGGDRGAALFRPVTETVDLSRCDWPGWIPSVSSCSCSPPVLVAAFRAFATAAAEKSSAAEQWVP